MGADEKNNIKQGESVDDLQKRMVREQRRIKLHRFTKHPMSILGLSLVILMVIIALGAPLLATHDPYDMVVADRLKAPCAEYLFGTDSMEEISTAEFSTGPGSH